jgi:hypothetical protein
LNEIVFKINATTKIIITLDELLEHAHCCTECSVTLFYNDIAFDLSTHSLRDCLQDFKCAAGKLVKNELQLHESITEDIGFLLNEELQFKPGLFQVKRGDAFLWVGYDYLLIMGYSIAVWLYNKSDGTIICEVSPKFPFSYRNSAKDENYVPYNKWIKKYEPYCIIEASLETIREWVFLADRILGQIQKKIDTSTNNLMK